MAGAAGRPDAVPAIRTDAVPGPTAAVLTNIRRGATVGPHPFDHGMEHMSYEADGVTHHRRPRRSVPDSMPPAHPTARC